VERRRHERALIATRPSVQRALGSWKLLLEAWQVVFEGARTARNWERMALAESKLDQCQREISRLEALLKA
jgi:hypothetical protein